VLASQQLGSLDDSVARRCLVLNLPEPIREIVWSQLDRANPYALVPIFLEWRLIELVTVLIVARVATETHTITASANRIKVQAS